MTTASPAAYGCAQTPKDNAQPKLPSAKRTRKSVTLISHRSRGMLTRSVAGALRRMRLTSRSGAPVSRDMLFTSSTFLFAFLPLLLAAYYAAPHRLRNSILLVASLLFYAWGQPSGLVLLPLSIAINYWVGRSIERARGDGRSAAAALRFGIGFNLAFLFTAK